MAVMDLAAPVAALVTVLLVVWGIYALSTGEAALLRERVGQYNGRRSAGGQMAVASGLFKDRSFSSIGALDRALAGRGYAERVALDLARAAVPLRVGEYLLIRWMVAAALFLLGLIFGLFWPLALVLGFGGFLLPKLYVSQKEKGRIKKLEDQLVDALTLMSNSLRSGSSFLQAMELVSRELPEPISQEFAQVVAEVGVGSPIEQALSEMRLRVRSYDLYLIVTAMTIQRSVGGNLAEVLGNIAGTIRERQRLLRQVVVETAEQRFSAYILMALPTFMLFAIGALNRSYLDPLLVTNPGRMLLVGALAMQLVGYLVMRRIVDIKV